MNGLTDTYVLSNGYKIPCVGFGTWQTPDGETAVASVKAAIKAGYRHIDTAAIYGNEVGVGQGIKESGIDRSELFVTSKVWNSERGYDTTIAAFEKTLKDLQLDYLDLYLIHWPASSHQFENWEELNVETWRAMTDLYKAGKIKAIGVSNFLTHHIKPLLEMEVKPMVNQLRYHPGVMWDETVALCKEHGILIEAYSPLGTGTLLGDPALNEIAAKYGKSCAQLLLRWSLQMGALPLPKSVTESRIIDNTKIFDFEISKKDMDIITAMENPGKGIQHPDEVDF